MSGCDIVPNGCKRFSRVAARVELHNIQICELSPKPPMEVELAIGERSVGSGNIAGRTSRLVALYVSSPDVIFRCQGIGCSVIVPSDTFKRLRVCYVLA